MKYRILLIMLFGVVAGFCLSAAEAAENAAPEYVLQENFDNNPEGWDGLQEYLNKAEGIDGSSCFKISIAEGGGKANLLISKKLDPEKIRGRAVVLEGCMKAENLKEPEVHYLGPKIMMHYTTSSVQSYTDVRERKYGTFDWQPFRVYIKIPQDVASADVNIGLQATTGTLWIDNLKVYLVPQITMPEPDMSIVASKEVQKEPKLRGFMIQRNISPEEIAILASEWNVNLVRYQFSKPRTQNISGREGYMAWLDDHMKRLDELLPAFEANGIKVLIDLHVAPLGQQTEVLSNMLSWTKESQDILVETWQIIAKHYKDQPAVWGYDLLNEPREDDYVWQEDIGEDWNHLALRVAKVVRGIDPLKPIIIEPAYWGSAQGLAEFTPVNVPNVIYSFHFYSPHALTHQGVHGAREGVLYPAVIDGKKWDKEALRKAMQPVVDFQQKYHVPIYCGEFSAIRWAPEGSGERWLKDVIEILEENGWDWSYHAFREYNGWDPEMNSDKNDTKRKDTTPRMELLKSYFAKNQR